MHSSRHTQRTIRSLGGLAAATPAGDQSAIAAVTRRGYTGHSMLGSMGLIHMNGRVHDAILGRFLSPDPTVPHPGFTQSYNRYAYVNNNPLSFIDPSGFSEASTSRRPMDVLAEIVVWGAVEGCGSLAGHEEAMCLALINWFDTLGAGDLMCMMAGGLACQPLAGFQQADSEQSAGVGGYSTGPRNRGSRAAGAKAVSAATVMGAKPQSQEPAERSLLGKVFDSLTGKNSECGKTLDCMTFPLWGGKTAAAAAARGFESFSALKYALGPAGAGKHWHHIVEQTPGNLARFGPQAVHNTQNVMRLDAGVHQQISGYYSSIQSFTGGQTVRQWIGTQSFEQQAQFGIYTLRRFGVGL